MTNDQMVISSHLQQVATVNKDLVETKGPKVVQGNGCIKNKLKLGIRLKNWDRLRLKKVVDELVLFGFEFICFDVMSNEMLSKHGMPSEIQKMDVPFTTNSQSMIYSDWSQRCVCMINGTKEISSADELSSPERFNLIKLQVEYALHLGTVLMFELDEASLIQIAKIIMSRVMNEAREHCFSPVWIIVNVTQDEFTEGQDSRKKNSSSGCSWNLWNKFRTYCEYSSRVWVVLRLPVSQQDFVSHNVIQRWLSEPVAAVIVAKESILDDFQGIRTMENEMLNAFLERVNRIIFEEVDMTLDDAVPSINMLSTMRLKKAIRGPENYNDNVYPKSCRPLNPGSSLVMEKYIEKDFFRFEFYQYAITAILKKEFRKLKSLTVVILDFKHWQLFNAFKEAVLPFRFERGIQVFVLQKDPNILQTLLVKDEKSGGSKGDSESSQIRISFVCADVFDWQPAGAVEADLVICDTIGSFGCNLLLPEFMYAAKKFLNAGGNLIPKSVMSFIQPISSNEAYHGVRNHERFSKPFSNSDFETPVKANLARCFPVDIPRELFTFRFGKSSLHSDETGPRNHLVKKQTFKAQFSCLLHGFAGYFKAKLYEKFVISTVPSPATSANDFAFKSWLPAFFPLKVPLLVHKGDEIEVAFWRISTSQQMWYEWTISRPVPLLIHNINGQSYRVLK